MKKNITIYLAAFSFMGLLFITGCEKLVEVDSPRTQLVSATVFENDQTASAAIAGIYSRITFSSGGLSGLSYLVGMSADELQVQLDVLKLQFYQNELANTNPFVGNRWQEYYGTIYLINSMLEGLERSTKITAALKNQLTGEGLFLRAFFHFYLVNLYGNVPYLTGTDYRANGLAARLPATQVYDKIVTDLTDAMGLLKDNYSYSKNERVRANKWVAASMLARVYLYRQNWAQAEAQATSVIDVTVLYKLSANLDSVFLKNSTETIWQLIPPYPQKFTNEGAVFVPSGYEASMAILSDDLYAAFETNDVRKNKWVASYTSPPNSWRMPFKYKEKVDNGSGAEYATVLRLAEQYLVRAEARARQNKLTGPNSAQSDINVIRNRAGLTNTSAITQADLLLAIEQERRVELFTEWGHRWFDLKRTQRAIPVLSVLKPKWNNTDTLFPVPASELLVNPNLTQNPGY